MKTLKLVLFSVFAFFIFTTHAYTKKSLPKNKTEKRPSGLVIEWIKKVEAPDSTQKNEAAAPGDVVFVHYTGTLSDGKQFDSSINGPPFSFRIAKQGEPPQVIAGWNEGLVGLKVGDKIKLTIPPALAYGVQGAPPTIPPNATLLFEIERVKAN